jgi:hypothetical protein
MHADVQGDAPLHVGRGSGQAGQQAGQRRQAEARTEACRVLALTAQQRTTPV